MTYLNGKAAVVVPKGSCSWQLLYNGLLTLSYAVHHPLDTKPDCRNPAHKGISFYNLQFGLCILIWLALGLEYQGLAILKGNSLKESKYPQRE